MLSSSILKKSISAITIGSLLLISSPIGVANAAAVITEVTPVAAITNNPVYIFNSTTSGPIAYLGPCSGTNTLTTASIGNNSVLFNNFGPTTGDISGCTISVDDGAGLSNILNVPDFIFDNEAPNIGLQGLPTISVGIGGIYTDSGATFSDNRDGTNVPITWGYSGSVNTSSGGTYVITYNYTDRAGNLGSTSRTINVTSGGLPSITLNGSGTMNIALGSVFVDPGFSAFDPEDLNITNRVSTGGMVDTNTAGTYILTYNVTDLSGNSAPTRSRTVIVHASSAPTITLIGSGIVLHELGTAYFDSGATANDLQDGDLTPSIVASGVVQSMIPDTYSITYNVMDFSMTPATPVTRIIVVADRTPPIITLSGASVINVIRNANYIDAGATWADSRDGTGVISASGSVNISMLGTYVLTYNRTDSAGNVATPVSRTVNVIAGSLPVLTLSGSNPMNIGRGDLFVNPGATAFDTEDGTLTGVTFTGVIDTSTLGTYTGTYRVSDSSNNVVTITRTINVIAGNAPTITILGNNPYILMRGSVYTDSGATANDTEDGNITPSITFTGILDANIVGSYTGTYTVTDSNRNTVSASRIINVVAGGLPTIILNGSGTMRIPLGGTYTELGATATDAEDGIMTGAVSITGSVNTGSVGTYIITYSVTDSNLNTVTLNRIVDVTDNVPPVITLNGSGAVTINAGTAFVDPGARWTDNIDGSGTIIASGTLNTNLAGVYTLFYNRTDAGGNAGVGVTRTVTVIGSVAPAASNAGPGGGGGGNSYGGNFYSPNVNLNSAPNLSSPADTLIPNIVRLLRTASHFSASNNSKNITEGVTHEIVTPITDYICPVVQEFYSVDDAGIQNVSEGEFTADVQSLMMYRSLDADEENLNADQRYILSQSHGIVPNYEFYDGKRAITRAEFVKMLVRSLSCHYTISGNESEYSDVMPGAWYTDYINFASENGWISGYADGTFRPHAPITRGEAAKILSNAIQLEITDDVDVTFFDVPSSSDFASYVYALKNNNIIGGVSDYAYAPNNNISRNEVAKIFSKTFLDF
ncbi:DUF5011 domain-containing protein [Candidatus Gracilibacteria bacterium]|nr:DUF5011 domain-containing protein [Candidatus Gracilibacteria bacterium]